MRLLVVRHGIAEDAAAWAASGGAESARPLTEEGRRRFREAARALRAEAGPFDLVVSSPLARAFATAGLLAGEGGELAVSRELAPGAPVEALVAWLGTLSAAGTVAIVGHEPDLSALVGLLLGGTARPLVAMRKGGACLVEFDGPPRPGEGRLLWLLTGGQARHLAR